MKARRKEKMRIGFSSNRFNPGRRIRDQRSAKDSTEEKRYGQGGRKGEERQLWSLFHIQTISLCMGMRRRRKEMEITSICPSVSDDDDLMTRRLWYILWFLRAATAISLMPRDLLTSATTRYKIREAWECLWIFVSEGSQTLCPTTKCPSTHFVPWQYVCWDTLYFQIIFYISKPN